MTATLQVSKPISPHPPPKAVGILQGETHTFQMCYLQFWISLVLTIIYLLLMQMYC